MDKTGRNGIRVGDITLPNFKAKYDALVEKHKQILSHHNFSYNLAEMEPEWFAAIEELKSYQQIDSEHYLNEALRNKKNYSS